MTKLSQIMVSISLLSLLGFVFACATPVTNISTQQDGTFRVTSTSYSESRAEKAALNAAQDYCERLGKKLVNMQNHPTETWTQASNARDPQSSRGSFDPQTNTGNIEKTHPSDIRVTLGFRCI